MAVVDTYPLSNYGYDNKGPKAVKDATTDAYNNRMRNNYMRDGIMRATVEGILLVHQHNHPHVLLLKSNGRYILPGGRLRPGENDIEGLRRKLSSKLAAPGFEPDWKIGECVAVWWVSNLDTRIFYPICPPHITKPKECRKLFLVHLSSREYFQVPESYTLVAVPLFYLYDNHKVFGSVIASIPEILSRFHITMK